MAVMLWAARMSWWRSLGRRAYHAAPAGFWRSVDGLGRDIRGLPGRLSDPAKRRDPWHMLHHVGGGDYHAIGQSGLEMLRTHGRLTADDRVLDIGCGNGRMAWPLMEALGLGGSYVGFDVSRSAIRYCRKRAAGRQGFVFQHMDIHNGVYNPGGTLAETELRFPCADGGVTLVFATSVFTHLPMTTIRHYLAETRRVLAPGGRGLFTVFALTPQVRAWIGEGRTSPPMQPYRDGAMTIDARWPENGLAYDEDLFHDAVREAGLTLEAVERGQWRPEPTYAGGQDLLVVRA